MEEKTKSWLFAVFDKDQNESEIASQYILEFYKTKGKQAEISLFYDTQEIINAFRRQNNFTAVFIGMRSMDEVDAAWDLRKIAPKCSLVIMSDCGDYAMEGYRLDAFDYWLKPLDEKKIYKTLERLNKVFC